MGNFFKKLFSWFSDLLVTFSKTAAYQAAERLVPLIITVVQDLEDQEMSGSEKAGVIKDYVQGDLKRNAADFVVDLAIGICLSLIRDTMEAVGSDNG